MLYLGRYLQPPVLEQYQVLEARERALNLGAVQVEPLALVVVKVLVKSPVVVKAVVQKVVVLEDAALEDVVPEDAVLQVVGPEKVLEKAPLVPAVPVQKYLFPQFRLKSQLLKSKLDLVITHVLLFCILKQKHYVDSKLNWVLVGITYQWKRINNKCSTHNLYNKFKMRLLEA